MLVRLARLTFLAAPLLALAAAMAWAAVTHVDQVGQRFTQSSLTVRTGGHVAFSNSDDVQHNIKVIDGGGDASDHGLQRPGETINVLFSKSGRFIVRCAIHPRMKLPVDVQ